MRTGILLNKSEWPISLTDAELRPNYILESEGTQSILWPISQLRKYLIS